MEYKDQLARENIIKLRELCSLLPPFASDFFRGIEPRTASRTRIAYAYDLQVFFRYLIENHPDFANKKMNEISLSDLEKIETSDLERFAEYVKYYKGQEDLEHINGERAVKRKICTLKTFYNYFYKAEKIQKNTASFLAMPKIHDKNIIRLDPGEVATLLDEIESGDSLTKKQQDFHKKTHVRDLALITLLLGTGIRVSECVGLNIRDYDEREGCIHIFRKGGKESTVYFGDEVMDAMEPYLEQRMHQIPVSGHEEALFLSLQLKRISVRSVENLVKKYTSTLHTYKKITPHKLRSTYGTSLYQATGDIYLVADVLGHSDVNTTKKHYAAIAEEQRKLARNKVRLRSDEENADSSS